MGRRSYPNQGRYFINYRHYYNQMSASLRAVVDRLCDRDCELPPERVRAEAVDLVMREVEKPCRCRKCEGIPLEDRLLNL